MKDYRSLPFAAYDLAVYLPGGAIILVLVASALGIDASNSFINFELSKNATVNAVIEGLFWFSASYLTGHLAAFLSTYVVEKPVHNWLGFPSQNYELREREFQKVLGRKSRKNFGESDLKKFRENVTEEQKRKLKEYSWSASSIIGLCANAPLALHILAFQFFAPLGFFNNKIPLGYSKLVSNRISEYGLGEEPMRDSRWHKLLEHIVANNFPSAFNRMYNYLIIYGALRLLALILLGATWWAVIRFPYSIDWATAEFWRENAISDAVAASIMAWAPLVLVSTTYCFCVMAFTKFNRRYFEESVYAILVDGRQSTNSHSVEHTFPHLS